MGGHLLMRAVREAGARLLPIDSEHNAIFQCMPVDTQSTAAEKGVSKVLLTASGGPFRRWSTAQMFDATPDQACAHPNWSMGRKISVDSASLMNKGLEFIEACWIFDLAPEQVDVVVHPQSIIHSMVQYLDGSVLAQLGNPDMRTAIAYGLGWPDRLVSGVAPLDLVATAVSILRHRMNRVFPVCAWRGSQLRSGAPLWPCVMRLTKWLLPLFLIKKFDSPISLL